MAALLLFISCCFAMSQAIVWLKMSSEPWPYGLPHSRKITSCNQSLFLGLLHEMMPLQYKGRKNMVSSPVIQPIDPLGDTLLSFTRSKVI